MLKLHLKRKVTNRLALCGIWPGDCFVLLPTLSRQSDGTVCQNCIWAAAAAAALARKHALLPPANSRELKLAHDSKLSPLLRGATSKRF